MDEGEIDKGKKVGRERRIPRDSVEAYLEKRTKQRWTEYTTAVGAADFLDEWHAQQVSDAHSQLRETAQRFGASPGDDELGDLRTALSHYEAVAGMSSSVSELRGRAIKLGRKHDLLINTQMRILRAQYALMMLRQNDDPKPARKVLIEFGDVLAGGADKKFAAELRDVFESLTPGELADRLHDVIQGRVVPPSEQAAME
jgi:hypothetical protein